MEENDEAKIMREDETFHSLEGTQAIIGVSQSVVDETI